MKKVSDVFKSIRFAKEEPRGKPHLSTDDEEHGAVGEKEFEQQLKHVKKRAMQEEKKDKYDEGEYDQEGDMVKSDLRSIMANAQKLHDMIDDAENLPEWCQNKVTLAEDYISTVANYMTAEMNEEVEYLEEKNAPTNPSLWARAKSLARQKFDVYPSAYANGWAAKWYKSKGGGWKSVSEAYNTMSPTSYDDQPMVAFRKKENEKKKEEPPFDPDPPKKKSAVAGKHGIGYSTVRHLARTAMKKQMKEQSIANASIKADVVKKRPHIEPAASPLKESRKADIVREIVKNKKNENGKAKDKFEANPTLTSEIVKEDK
ncbi:MAG: hypothetical protein EBR30_03975 [Cytophagia bacterium]|nr:hypothetical protein [Cytophagia bacterium]NBW34172.1 hypothetical protein [Cytophagia bacterium]